MNMTYKDMISLILQNDTDVDAYFSCYQEPIQKSIKIISHKITLDSFFEEATTQGWHLTSPSFIKQQSAYDTYYITRDDDSMGLGKHWLHTGGFFYMQEVAASLPAHILPLKSGDIVLDMCAAPGGKSVQLGDRLLQYPQTGFVVSNEMSGSRIISLQHNLNRTGMYNSCVTNMSGSVFGSIAPNFFDAILVDAPCSGEGTGFKSDAGTKWRREDMIHKIARTQKELLTSAIKACKPGGYIVYATCTLNPRENEGVLAYVLEKYGEYISLEHVDIENKTDGLTARQDTPLLSSGNAKKVARFWPHIQHTGGFFISLIKKHTETHFPSKEITKKTASQLDFSPAFQQSMIDLLQENFGITLPENTYFFVSTQKQIYITTTSYIQLHDQFHIEKIGVPIFKWNNNKEARPLHGLGNILGHLATKNTLTFDDHKQLQKYSDGFDLDTDFIPTTKDSYLILKYKNYGFSVGKVVQGTLKNKYIK